MRVLPHSGELILTRAASWTASDTKELNTDNGIPFSVKGVSVNADGNLAIKTRNSMANEIAPEAAVTIAVKAGIIYPIAPFLIMSTNTTATGIVVYG